MSAIIVQLSEFEKAKQEIYLKRYPQFEKRKSRWVGFDFDGTLSEEVDIKSKDELDKTGSPIRHMVERLKHWLNLGFGCKIFTARIAGEAEETVDLFKKGLVRFLSRDCGLQQQEIQRIGLTCTKDRHMFLFYDDRSLNPESLRPKAPEFPSIPAIPKTAQSCIETALKTVRQRQAVYKDNHKQFGKFMKVLFPKVCLTTEEWNRVGVVSQVVAKLSRYCNSGMTHIDSAHDIIGYGALLESLTSSDEKENKA